ncbi:2-hydroxychromene-2-carboxylate isomerase [Diplocarpon rosae]|nr:2-hydroxychromene-2-carboxylate isomerase [Diplocarpon rosae]
MTVYLGNIIIDTPLSPSRLSSLDATPAPRPGVQQLQHASQQFPSPDYQDSEDSQSTNSARIRMAPPKLTLYVDTNDPVFAGCDITYIPVFLGGIMKACNNVPPIRIKSRRTSYLLLSCSDHGASPSPAARCGPLLTPGPLDKGTYIGLERQRWARLFSVPMAAEAPDGFPHLTLTIMRALCALTVLHPGREGLMAMAGKEGKEVLMKNSDLAVERGAFGLPYFEATNREGETEMFWGVDHLGLVTSHLGLQKPAAGGWKALL